MKKITLSTLATATLVSFSYGLTLKESVNTTLKSNAEIISNQYNIEASKQDIEIEKSAYKPKIDLSATVRKEDRTRDYSDSRIDKHVTTDIDGYITNLSAEQLIYDGGKTFARIDEKKHTFTSTLMDMNQKNDSTLFNVTKTYNRLVENSILSQINQFNIESHNNALGIAQEKEQISGEALESKKTLSLLSNLKDAKLSQEADQEQNKLEFERLTGIKDVSQVCRPLFNENSIPSTLDQTIQLALQNNQEIQKQKALVNQQLERINSQEANYLPVVKGKIQGSLDNDIELEEAGDQKSILGELSLNWNFYSGGKDSTAIEKEKINLKKEQKSLENTQNIVVEKVSTLYNKYTQTKKRLEILQTNLSTDRDILRITRNQLADGTKTFADELESKTKVLESQSNIVKLETQLQDVYFELQYHMGNIKNAILQSPDQACQTIKVDNYILDETKDTGISLNQFLQNDTKVNEVPLDNASLANTLKNIYSEDYSFDPDTLTATFNISSHSFTTTAVNDQDIFRKILDSFSNDFLNILNDNQNSIDRVIINSYTSSEFRKFSNSQDITKANEGLSQRRANKVQDYFVKRSMQQFGDASLVNKKFLAMGHGSDNLVYTNGKEDKTASRRITIQVVPK